MDEYFWDDLIQFIEEDSVIPIIGPELLILDIDGQTIPLYQFLAVRLAAALRISLDDLPENPSLIQVIYHYLGTPNSRREVMYRRMKSIMAEQNLPTPEPLKKLAAIKPFRLFVSTTMDSLMETAINEVRFEGEARTQSLAFTFNDPADIPCEVREMTKPIVYQLFGQVSSQPDYVLTEEDTLEFIHSLQSHKKRPNLLFDELRSHHLLLLGNDCSNWLARFFLRTVRNKRLTVPGDREAILAGEAASRDQNLVLFLGSLLSQDTQVYDRGGAADFVDELYNRWIEIHPLDKEVVDEPHFTASTEDDTPDLESGGIFLSYASDDVEIVERVKEALEEENFDIWFDKRRLEPGDDYDMKIRRNIRNCALFCPFISENTERRLEGYFRREWNEALDRAKTIHSSIPFILPVVIDDTTMYAGGVPEEFHRWQWTRLEGGRLTEEFVATLRRGVREYRKRKSGRL